MASYNGSISIKSVFLGEAVEGDNGDYGRSDKNNFRAGYTRFALYATGSG
ncbi:MAG: hypothetical protein KAG93_03415 [Desulfuromusa sp.]|nr:hypothetical protein [Desulfuromusa sp.]